LRRRDADRLAVIRVVYEQQEAMYREKKNSIPNRIVSLSQPYIRPIVRGKAKTPTEFGAKIDMSVDENGMARLEKMSFDAYNESDVLIGAIQRYYERWNHYPERVLVDQIYRNRKNLAFCKEHGIRVSGPTLGRPKKDPAADIRTEYQDAVDRIEVERGFS
jgi:transposase, IS4 family